MSQEFPYAPTLSRADDGNHTPDQRPIWQESSFVAFMDPVPGIAAIHRIGIHPNRGEGNMYSWTGIGGRIVSRAKRTGLPLPAGPVTGTTLDGICFETPEPLRSCRVRVDRDGVRTDVLFESFTGPVQMNMDVAGATIGAGHYDSLGRVHGTVSAGGVTHAVDGVGFLDHSWGARAAGGILAHRWFMAVLDAHNHVNTFPTWGTAGRSMLGYMVLDGELSFVTDVQSELHVADDHISLAGARAKVTDKLGRTVELQGRAVGEFTIQPYGEGYFCAHGPLVYEGRGRLWRGMVEWSAMRTVPPWHLDKLGLGADNEWLARSAQQG